MKEFTSADVTRNSGDVFAAAAAAPVAITKHRKKRFVVMSIDRYEQLAEAAETRQAYVVDDMPEALRASLIGKLEHDLAD